MLKFFRTRTTVGGARRAPSLAVIVALLGACVAQVVVQVAQAPSAAATTATYPSIVQADNPLAYYRLDESSGTTAADASGHGRSGTYGPTAQLNKPGLIAGDSDAAVNGPDTNTVMSASAAGLPSGNAARSIEFWFATTNGGQRYTNAFVYGNFGVGMDSIYGINFISDA
ncbi:MAG: hypothetical protein JOZ68_17820, partial [Acidimicrobiia bacterium]|nr:hypothetical protein [Acidimicrobiia bacterium]